MNEEPTNVEDKNNELVPTEPLHDIAGSVARIDAVPTLAEKSRLLWEMPVGRCVIRPSAHCPRRWWPR